MCWWMYSSDHPREHHWDKIHSCSRPMRSSNCSHKIMSNKCRDTIIVCCITGTVIQWNASAHFCLSSSKCPNMMTTSSLSMSQTYARYIVAIDCFIIMKKSISWTERVSYTHGCMANHLCWMCRLKNILFDLCAIAHMSSWNMMSIWVQWVVIAGISHFDKSNNIMLPSWCAITNCGNNYWVGNCTDFISYFLSFLHWKTLPTTTFFSSLNSIICTWPLAVIIGPGERWKSKSTK